MVSVLTDPNVIPTFLSSSLVLAFLFKTVATRFSFLTGNPNVLSSTCTDLSAFSTAKILCLTFLNISSRHFALFSFLKKVAPVA